MKQFNNLVYDSWLTKLINCLEKILYKWSNFCLNIFSRTTKYLFCLCLFSHIFSLPAFSISCNLLSKFPCWYLYVVLPLTWCFLILCVLFIFLLDISTPLLQTFSGPLRRALSGFAPCIPMLSSAVRLLEMFQHLHLLQVFFSLRDFPPCIISRKKKRTCLCPTSVAQQEHSTSGIFSPAWLTEYYNLGQIFMQRKLTLVALVTNNLYCQKALSYISVVPWKTSFCPLDDLSLVRTTYLSYQTTYWFNEMNRANEIAHCIISITN